MMHEKLQQFIDFCTHKPKDEHYKYDDSGVCALGQFNHYNRDGWESEFSMCDGLASQSPRTFGALTERLRHHYRFCMMA